MRMCEIKSGVVVNIAEFDPDNIPEWASGWVAAEDSTFIGNLWDGSSFSLDPSTEEKFAIAAREDRDAVLANEVDPIVCNPFRWDALTTEKQQEWIDFRQALLDVPQQEGFPEDITWPTKPE